MSKKKYTKCQCCPYYAKEQQSKKWECSLINRASFPYGEYRRNPNSGICIFNYATMGDKTLETANTILERWIRANKE